MQCKSQEHIAHINVMVCRHKQGVMFSNGRAQHNGMEQRFLNWGRVISRGSGSASPRGKVQICSETSRIGHSYDIEVYAF